MNLLERLDIVGHLEVLGEGPDRLSVEFRDGMAVLELPDLRAALSIRGKLTRVDRRAWLRTVQSTLVRAGLMLQVRVGRRTVGRLGPGTRPGRLSYLLGVDPMQLDVRAVAAMLARRSPGPTRGRAGPLG